jgi:hypothetical protein
VLYLGDAILDETGPALVDLNAIIETGELVERFRSSAAVTRTVRADHPAATG